ncbi:hypothetical protein GCM10010464_71820 [Pseudonocardia yunnanensis]|uniref:DUF222 domain-containing protein n=1 Tax=Pseudonocardia yunnanensis TaxID=58107 RepID=A0ABW4F8D2_9PSEU
MPPEAGELTAQLDALIAEATSALDELRELTRSIHPPILAEGGLHPALKTLARPARADRAGHAAAARADRDRRPLHGCRGLEQRP